ncbi:MAG TPA: GDSL-type esterase/lipase family protein [Balneolaceae bacterium]|nr:GDSL-type esterase/lipase family protein [Balneolaceae bacterium]
MSRPQKSKLPLTTYSISIQARIPYKLLTILSLLILIACSGGNKKYQAAKAPIQVMGRHLNDNGAIKFAASGVTFYMKFQGTHLDVDLQDEFRDSTNYNWFTVVVDNGTPKRFRTRPGKEWYTLADSLQSGEHNLILSKATEGQNGHNELVAIRTGKLLQTDPLPKRKIEFIGDSITCGYGDDARQTPCNKGTWFDQTHAWYAYGPRLARHFNAQWMLSSVSGIGMHRNWNSPSPTMPDVYGGVFMEYTDSITPWDFDRYVPDLIVIALGTNDFSAGGGKEPRPDLDGDAFVNDYTQFVGRVHKIHPAAKILLLNSPMFGESQREKLAGYLQRVIANRKATGDSTITRFAFENKYSDGCDGHPNLKQQGKMADALEPKISSFMGW